MSKTPLFCVADWMSASLEFAYLTRSPVHSFTTQQRPQCEQRLDIARTLSNVISIFLFDKWLKPSSETVWVAKVSRYSIHALLDFTLSHCLLLFFCSTECECKCSLFSVYTIIHDILIRTLLSHTFGSPRPHNHAASALHLLKIVFICCRHVESEIISQYTIALQCEEWIDSSIWERCESVVLCLCALVAKAVYMFLAAYGEYLERV